MGFCRLHDGPEEVVSIVKGDPGELYIEVSSEVRNRLEVIVGTKIKCLIKGICDKDGNMIKEINQERIWEIIGYWHELYIPAEDEKRFGIKQGDYLRAILISVDRVTEFATREEVDI
jgi:hypothetical protein